MKDKPNILIVDDNKDYLKSLQNALGEDFSIAVASSAKEAKGVLPSGFDLLLLDIRLDDSDVQNKEGIDLLKEIRGEYPHLPVIMITAYGDIDIAVEAMKRGASDFIQKARVNIREISKAINNVLKKAELERRVLSLQQELDRIEPRELIGEAPEIQEVRKIIDMVAEDGQVPVLIRGETGTGKELVARAIHSRGVRKSGVFVDVALSSLNSTTITSELFGHERGAFTGARERRIGLIEEADKGILFLDEIGDLEGEIQSKLLRVLEEKEFTRLGGNRKIKVDIQLVTATNRDLEEAVRKGSFREELYFRLKGVEIHLPSLSSRRDDIPLLCRHFLGILKGQGRTKIEEVSEEAMRMLESYDWPGNVRELRQSLERAILFARHHNHQKVMPEDLPYEIQKGQTASLEKRKVEVPQQGVNVEEELARMELTYIEQALKRCNGRKTKAWSLLGYNDRFALRRRVDAIKQRYPHLFRELPYLRKKFQED